MKKFVMPFYEIVYFSSSIITTSGGCCEDPIDHEPYASNCIGDIGYCSCTINHSPAEDNCTPCATNQGA